MGKRLINSSSCDDARNKYVEYLTQSGCSRKRVHQICRIFNDLEGPEVPSAPYIKDHLRKKGRAARGIIYHVLKGYFTWLGLEFPISLPLKDGRAAISEPEFSAVMGRIMLCFKNERPTL
jgi:hypothetical protein